jgi:DNA repair exonuclease SbcCD ATPase subunit
MSEDQQAQEQNAARGEDTQAMEDTRQERSEPSIPKHRFDQVNKAKKEAEQELQRIRNEIQSREEQQAQAQGEYQQLAEKRQKKIDSLQAEVQSLKNQITRDRRYRAWTASATQSIKPAALGDAFDMITDDEWDTINIDDENAVKMLADNLAERKEYLALSPVGNGSGGSGRPVFGLKSNQGNSGKSVQTGTRKTLHFEKKRPSWK